MQAAFYKGRERAFNRIVADWERGPYSHGELVLGYEGDKAICWSSSFQDKGVRRKEIVLRPDHWDLINLDLSFKERSIAEQYYQDRNGWPYDVRGVVRFGFGPMAENPGHLFCTESMAEALGIQDGWRFGPNALAAVLRYRYQGVNQPTS